MLPVGKDKYEKKIKTQVIKRVVRELKYGDHFGFEEMVTLRSQRIFKAKVVGKTPAILMYIPRAKFLEYLT